MEMFPPLEVTRFTKAESIKTAIMSLLYNEGSSTLDKNSCEAWLGVIRDCSLCFKKADWLAFHVVARVMLSEHPVHARCLEIIETKIREAVE